MKTSKEVQRRKNKKRFEGRDPLAVEIQIRKRYASSWPNVILELTKRVQAVNQGWAEIMQTMMMVDLRVSYARITGGLEIIVSYKNEVEHIEISYDELTEAMQYAEVLVMDRIKRSGLYAKALSERE